MNSAGLELKESATRGILIVAYGNPIRSDDGIAWHAAALLRESLPSPAIEILSVHQLTPELAESVSRAAAIVFLDATCAARPGEILCAPVSPESDCGRFSHVLTPAQIVAFSERLYGKAPPAFAVSIGGESFDHGDALSETLKNALPRVVRTVEELIHQLADPASSPSSMGS